MANSYFRFKQFSVRQDNCAMKVGTDGVLIGAWAGVEHARRVLDIGAGTGLVALMLAQRSRADVFAVEIDEPAFVQMKRNITESPWPERITAVHSDIRLYRPGFRFDAIVSNPPYFRDSLVSPDKQRALARHNDSLSYGDLLEAVSLLLSAEGEFSVIIPFDVAEDVKKMAASFGLFPFRRLDVITSPGKSPKRSLVAFASKAAPLVEGEILLEKGRHVYSDEYIALTKDYYLSM